MSMQNHEPSLEEMMRSEEKKNPEAGLLLAESYIKKYYLDNIDTYNVVNVPRTLVGRTVSDSAKLYRLTEVVLNKNEKVLERLNNVYSAMHSLGLSVIMLLTSTRTGVEFYLGVRVPNGQELNSEIVEAFERTFNGNFPGSEIQPMNDPEQVEALLDRIMPLNGSNAITALTSVPALKDENADNKKFTQGIEKFIDTMQGTEYAILIISDPVNADQLAWTKQGYEELYSELFPLAQTEMTIGKSDAESMSASKTDGVTETIGTSVSKTQSFSKGTSSARSESRTNTLGISMGAFGSQNQSTQTGKTTTVSGSVSGGIKGKKLSAAAEIGASVAKSVMQSVGTAMGLNGSVNASTARTVGYTDTESQNWGNSRQVGQQESTSNMHQTGTQQGTTTTDSTTATVHYANKSVQVMLELIEEQLKRIKDCENYGVWSSAAYFISPSRETSVVAASAYKGIINGETTALESSCMNTWFRDGHVRMINGYLHRLCHPRFYDPEYLSNLDAITDVTLTTMVNTKELAIQCNIPYRSVAGVTVREMAEFGRNLPAAGKDTQSQLRLGKIFHMGRPEVSDLTLDRQAMASHTFITGSTGAGKSNAVYHLLNEITKDGKTTFLIVEPAKGEYKHIFGNGTAAVYGTNPALTPLLRINPFAFPEGIHILEHIDRLVEIFNACWPMYAAMPAVLKDSVERVYENAGWDLRESVNPKGTLPTFFDLMNVLPDVIKESGYSNDTQSDYIGSLYTRVKSLTNGIYGSVFCAESTLTDEELFDRNVIVDLSRVGSMETKSLVMGILVMKLQEYRMCSGMMNSELRHVTVLEEAHNLLRRTSDVQTQEGANLQGKSVEMLANAIAEMRTYGEGFIIADQAPGLLDTAVIRNTNTKIILRLPDEEDRKLVGKAAALNEAQIDELAKLPVGVAAVYQNNWPEAVLCKMERYPAPQMPYHKPAAGKTVDTEFVFGQLAQSTQVKALGISEMEQLKRWLKRYETVLQPGEKQYLEQLFRGRARNAKLDREIAFDFFEGPKMVGDYCERAEKSDTPRSELLKHLESRYELEASTAEWVMNALVTAGVGKNPEQDAGNSLKRNFEEQGGRIL